jgi:hypothetical protein
MRAVLAAASGLVLAVVFFGSAPRRTFAAPAQTNARPVAYVPVPAGYSASTFDLAQPGQQIVYAQHAASPPPPEWLYAAAGALVGAGAATAWSRRSRAPAPRMQEPGEKEAPEKEAAEAPPKAPAPAPAEKKFDITDYSMTITIATVFLIVKGLSALGIPIGPQGR